MPVLDIDLGDTVLVDEIGQGAQAIVYRGKHHGRPVAVKMLRPTLVDDIDAALRFRQEASALARLDHPSVVDILEAGEAQGRPYLVMEHVEGRDLSQDVSVAGPMATPRLLDVARQVASALAEVHRHGLVHQDIKPSNLVRNTSGVVKIIDFGLASATSEERAADGHVAGTLLYAPPEQVFVTQRGIDGRADLYALGCTLYFCAAGHPPFQSEDASTLIQMHAAAEAPPLATVTPSVSEALSAIVAKLMAKDPLDRYQSAVGLLADLERHAELQTAVRAGTLALGTQDIVRLGTEVRLVGRERELGALAKSREALESGRGSFVLIEGTSGTGKTRLARELVDSLRGRGTLVMTAKCNEGETTPFGPFREALDRTIASLRRRDDDQAEARRTALRRAAGSWGGLLKRLSPGMRRLLEDVPDVAALDPSSEQIRFYDALAEFMAHLARGQQPVVLIIDDVQWLDRTSPEVLSRLSALVRNVPLLVVMTARNAGRDGEAVAALVQRLGSGLDHRVQLEGLSPEDTMALVAQHLGNRPVEAKVRERIAGLSHGNPFAVGQYVRALCESGALQLGPQGWSADDERLAQTDLTQDVVQTRRGPKPNAARQCGAPGPGGSAARVLVQTVDRDRGGFRRARPRF